MTVAAASPLSRDLIDSLFPPALPEPAHWEERYPPRGLPAGAEVTRFAPSPTGWLHIGGIFTASVNLAIARQSGGTYLLRVEDTDQSRFEEGALAQFEAGFGYFGIRADESELEGITTGNYGPYVQSERAQIYASYVRELMRQGKAYPCFATREELAQITARQKATGALPGYYGDWAVWRDAPEDQVRARLADGDPYVVRFRSPGVGARRVSYTDAIRGELTADDNRNDVVILKSSENALRLPTYHLAHVVDDHLMRVTLVVRGEEWISSVPLHHQLFDALGFERIRYAHIAQLMKQDGGSRRKLSKRKDPEASVAYYIEQGFPPEAVQYYLRGLANGRLAELPLPEALAAPIRLEDFGSAGPLADLVKLEDISADYVATLSGEEIIERVSAWAQTYDQNLVKTLDTERSVALAALTVERGPLVQNPRKDLRKWSDFRPVYGFFFPSVFEPVTDPSDERFADLDPNGGLTPDVVRSLADGFAKGYVPPSADPDADADWFDQVRSLATSLGFAKNKKLYKKDPGAYPGSIAEASGVIRILITGSKQSPDLKQVCAALGTDEVLRRVRAVLLHAAHRASSAALPRHR
ncbi:MAG: glutamate--tRNA ligase [Nocardiopsaceae bacterium]|nr:glutamate--tRNA ligase [Nocardiopsaceae bacterium]